MKGVGAAEAEIGEGGSQSTYLLAEVSVLARKINWALKGEKDLADRLPMDPDNDDLFNTCSDGLVLIYLLKMIDPALVNMKMIARGKNLNIFQVSAIQLCF